MDFEPLEDEKSICGSKGEKAPEPRRGESEYPSVFKFDDPCKTPTPEPALCE